MIDLAPQIGVFRFELFGRAFVPAPSPPGGGGPKRGFQAASRWGSIPNSTATCVADRPLLSHSSTACCLNALSNFLRDVLVWITGSLIGVLLFIVSLYLCPPFRRSRTSPDTRHTKVGVAKNL